VDQGFAHAWVTIVDTHVTTIVSAAILFPLRHRSGEGLCHHADLRSAANLFTAVFVSRVIFDCAFEQVEAGEMVSI
jgi:preprotein translocase subunit SecD